MKMLQDKSYGEVGRSSSSMMKKQNDNASMSYGSMADIKVDRSKSNLNRSIDYQTINQNNNNKI